MKSQLPDFLAVTRTSFLIGKIHVIVLTFSRGSKWDILSLSATNTAPTTESVAVSIRINGREMGGWMTKDV